MTQPMFGLVVALAATGVVGCSDGTEEVVGREEHIEAVPSEARATPLNRGRALTLFTTRLTAPRAPSLIVKNTSEDEASRLLVSMDLEDGQVLEAWLRPGETTSPPDLAVQRVTVLEKASDRGEATWWLE